MKKIKNLLPHILLILSLIFITFMILDEYNPTMEFINNSVSNKLFWVFCILSVINAVVSIVVSRKSEAKNYENK